VQSPTETDLDAVFEAALRLPPAKSATVKILSPPKGYIIDPFDPTEEGVSCTILSRRDQKLSENEIALASKLQRIRELKEILESRKNSKQDVLFSLGMTLFPPVAVLILGMGLMWVFSGFVPKPNK